MPRRRRATAQITAIRDLARKARVARQVEDHTAPWVCCVCGQPAACPNEVHDAMAALTCEVHLLAWCREITPNDFIVDGLERHPGGFHLILHTDPSANRD